MVAARGIWLLSCIVALSAHVASQSSCKPSVHGPACTVDSNCTSVPNCLRWVGQRGCGAERWMPSPPPIVSELTRHRPRAARPCRCAHSGYCTSTPLPGPSPPGPPGPSPPPSPGPDSPYGYETAPASSKSRVSAPDGHLVLCLQHCLRRPTARAPRPFFFLTPPASLLARSKPGDYDLLLFARFWMGEPVCGW